MSYPEKIPPSLKPSINSFKFNFAQTNKVKQSVEAEHSAISERIDAIAQSDMFLVSGYPILKNILILDPSKVELKKLAKALDRLADLVEVHSDLESKLSFIKTIENDPNWLAWTFGDFSQEVEQDIESFFKDLN
jgi:hypothetical protein